MRFTAATVAALAAIFAVSSTALAGNPEVDYNRCSPCHRENSCIKGRCYDHLFCDLNFILWGELCCPFFILARGDDDKDGGYGKGIGGHDGKGNGGHDGGHDGKGNGGHDGKGNGGHDGKGNGGYYGW